MKKNYLKHILAGAALMASVIGVNAQQCGSLSPEEVIRADESLTPAEKEQSLAEYHETLRANLDKWKQAKRPGEKADVLVIPVVFHIFHKFGPENLEEEQIIDQIRVLNEDFNAENDVLANVIPEFQDIIGDTEVEFRIASIDPDGNCTSGIIRYHEPGTYFEDRSGIQQLKREVGWPSNMYLNTYIVGSIESSGTGTIAGYAQFPGFGADNTDGIVIDHNYVGSIGTSSAGRAATTTHEVGHWFGLFHTWGNCAAAGSQAACNCDDGVDDTPLTIGHPSVCDLGAETCGSLDNVQNFMDYSFCYANFTLGQVERMRGALAGDASRANLYTSENLIATGSDYGIDETPTTLCAAAIGFDSTKAYCIGEEIRFTDRSFHNVTGRTWTFEGATVGSSTDYQPTVSFDEAGLKNVTLEVTNGVETRSTTVQVQIISGAELGGVPFNDDVEDVDLSTQNEYSVTDDGGDGITWTLSNEVSRSGGTKSLYLPNTVASNGAGFDYIVSNTIDLTQGQLDTFLFTFDYAHASKSSGNADQLNISFSNDCGENWRSVGTLLRSSLRTADNTTVIFEPADDSEWKTRTYSIPAELVTSNFQYRFRFTAGGGNNLYIDNIRITDQTVSVSELTANDIDLAVFPNPAKEQVNVSFNLAENQNAKISLLSLTGGEAAILYNDKVAAGNFTLNRTINVAPGVYLMNIALDKGNITKKVIIK